MRVLALGVGFLKEPVTVCVRDYKVFHVQPCHFVLSLTVVKEMAGQRRRRACQYGRCHPFIGHEGPQAEQRYSSTLFLNSALEGGEGSASRPCRSLTPGKTRYLFYRRLGGPQGRSGQVCKISPPPGFDPRTVQLVSSHYTDYAIRPGVAQRVPRI